MTERLVLRTSEALAKRTSRRGFLTRAALIGSAATIAPIRFLTHAEPAEAYVYCSNCSSSSKCCSDGYTEFCCSTNSGSNTCPSYGFFGGYWKCSTYQGNSYCTTVGQRYYIDCNRRPGESCPGGCHCGASDCNCRKTCCNVFRYGQCNTQITGTTEVICRVVKCENPASLGYNCSYSTPSDPATCFHESCKHCL